MSLNIHHPSGTVTSTTGLTFNVQGGTPTTPSNISLNASSVIMPRVLQPVGTAGAIIFDVNANRMRYYDGFQWIDWVPASDITGPIQISLDDIYNKLGTKVDSVIYNSSAIPTASISGTTLNITFPTSSGGEPVAIPGLFTGLPVGSITEYSLVSGQSVGSIREQMSGVVGGQDGRLGTQSNPYMTSSGWCLADGMWWGWQGINGLIVKQVPNLNQQAYRKSIALDGITKTDSVIAGSGNISATSLSIAQLPPLQFSVSGTTSVDGLHNHTSSGAIPSAHVVAERSSGAISTTVTTSSNGLHSHTFTGTSNILGSGQTHTHTLSNMDVPHFNTAVLYNIGEPSLALNESAGDARYVLKAGDTMTGSLTVANSLVLRDNATNLIFYMRNTSNVERATIYHSSTSNTLRFRSNGGAEVAINTAGELSAPSLRSAGVLNVSGASTLASTTINGPLQVNGQITATGDIWAFSDINLKENMKPISNALDRLELITGYIGNMIGEDTKRAMVSAQEIQNVLPEAVSTAENGYLVVNYSSLIPLLIESINELREEVRRGK